MALLLYYDVWGGKYRNFSRKNLLHCENMTCTTASLYARINHFIIREMFTWFLNDCSKNIPQSTTVALVFEYNIEAK